MIYILIFFPVVVAVGFFISLGMYLRDKRRNNPNRQKSAEN